MKKVTSGLLICRICRLLSTCGICRRLACDPRPAALKDELCLRIQATWNSLPQADIQNLFYSMPYHVATLISACGGCIKY